MLHGPEKFGKSTFVLDCPNAAHFDLGRETLHLPVPDRWEINSWQDLVDGVDSLVNGEHDRETFVLDTADRAEEFLWRHICERDRKANIEDYGYGKGYKVALTEFRELWRKFEKLQARGMHVVIVVHSVVKQWKNPLGEDYDKYVLKLHDSANSSLRGFVCDQADIIAFGNFQQVKSATDKTVQHGARRLFLENSAGYDSGCRFQMPAHIDFSWDALMAEWEAGADTEADRLIDEIQAMAADDDDLAKKIQKQLKKDGRDVVKLNRTKDRLAMKLAAQQEA